MDVIVCLDEKNGMLFHGRRQSRDRRVLEDIYSSFSQRVLSIRPFSASLFAEHYPGQVCVDPLLLTHAKPGDLCFVEDLLLKPWEDQIRRLFVYRWNRRSPGDFFFDLDLSANWRKVYTVDFPGYSHQKLTKEIYSR